MTKLFPIIMLFVLASCGDLDENNVSTDGIKPQKSTDSILTTSKDSIRVISDPYDTLVTKRLLGFAIYLDSIGFNCDTNRLKKIYNSYSKKPRYNINNHFFYSSTSKTGGLYYYFNYFIKNKKDDPEWSLDTVTLHSYKSITWYFFSELKPDEANGEKWYTDGIIEEWNFKDSSSAKIVAKDLGRIAPLPYFNVGAFVCYIDNYMYIITSRSSGSMWTLRKPVFKEFATRNKVTITNVDKWF
jgi:hypothetical protein